MNYSLLNFLEFTTILQRNVYKLYGLDNAVRFFKKENQPNTFISIILSFYSQTRFFDVSDFAMSLD